MGSGNFTINQKIKDIVYIREDIGDIVQLPRFVYTGSLTPFELEVLKKIRDRSMSTADLASNMKKSMPQILKYLKELEKKGLVISTKKNGERFIAISAGLIL